MSNNNPILKIGQEVLFVIGLYQKEEKLHKKKTPHAERHISDLGEIRTHDPRFRRPLLYPAELLRQINTNNYMKYSLPSQCLIVVFVGIVSKFMINWLKRLHFY